jgi:hypothetical protein
MDTFIVIVTLIFFAACITAVGLYIKQKETQSDIVKLEVEVQRLSLEAPTTIAAAQEEASRVRRESEAYALKIKQEAEVKLAEVRKLENAAEAVIARRKDEVERDLHLKLTDLRQREESSQHELKAKELAISQTEEKMNLELKDKALS